jgi:hypothetical protein
MQHEFEQLGILLSSGYEAGSFEGHYVAEHGQITEISVVTYRGRERKEQDLKPGSTLWLLLATALEASPGHAENIAETAPADERPYAPIRISARVG